MTTSAGAKSDIAVLTAAARKNGFKFVPAGGGHKKVVDKHGKPVVDNNGPLILTSTPGDARWRVMTVKRWIAAKVLKEDPFQSNQERKANRRLSGGAVTNRLTDPDIQAKKVAAIHAKAARERDETQKLREILEPIIVRIGGWGAGSSGKVTQIGDVAFWFNDWRGFVPNFSGQSGARAAIQSLKGKQTLSERNRQAVKYFLDELTKSQDPAARYFELYRLSKGLPAKEDETIRGGTPLPDPPMKGEREKRAEVTSNGGPEVAKATRPATKPGALALEAVAFMVMGKEKDEVDMDRVLQLGEEIQQMELSQRGLA